MFFAGIGQAYPAEKKNGIVAGFGLPLFHLFAERCLKQDSRIPMGGH
jgi:hypothetical protein